MLVAYLSLMILINSRLYDQSIVKHLPSHIAQFAINATASAILLLVEETL